MNDCLVGCVFTTFSILENVEEKRPVADFNYHVCKIVGLRQNAEFHLGNITFIDNWLSVVERF